MPKSLADHLAAGNIPPSLAGLAAEARKAGSFDDFKRDFVVEIKHGTYWHWTSDPNFHIDPAQGPRDMMNFGKVSHPGTLMVTSHLQWWADYDGPNGKGRPWVALIDLSEVPRAAYYQPGRNAGNEFFVSDPSLARVVAVLSPKQARDLDRRRAALLPDSPEQLRIFYDLAIRTPALTPCRRQVAEIDGRQPLCHDGATIKEGRMPEYIVPRWRKEFPEFPADLGVALPEGFEDASWHNDVCPFFLHKELDVGLWIDHSEPSHRTRGEFGEFPSPGTWSPRFILVKMEDGQHPAGEAEVLAQSDDMADIETALAALCAGAGPGPRR